MKSTLIFDTEITGHHIEYILHLINYIGLKGDKTHYFFVLHPKFISKFPEIQNKAINCTNIKLIEISANELDRINKGNTFTRSIDNYKLLIEYADKYNVNNLFLMHINAFIFALILYRSKFRFSGILFHQFYRIEKNSIANKIRFYRKYFQTWLLTLNNQIQTVFILNDNLTVNYLNYHFKTNIFKVLSDPIPEWAPITDFSINEKYNIKNTRRIFLHIGALEERKGTFEILDSFNFQNSETRRSICLLIFGKANSETHQIILSKVSDLKTRFPEVQIIYKNEFISNSMMKSLFVQSEFVLVPYKNSESSSGIIGHAIADGCKIIGPNKGLLGEYIKSYKQSIALDIINPKSIAIGISEAITVFNSHQKNYMWQEYVDSHTPESFARMILSDNCI